MIYETFHSKIDECSNFAPRQHNEQILNLAVSNCIALVAFIMLKLQQFHLILLCILRVHIHFQQINIKI
jgi:hypothetical protein